jgi:hypothetical protein
MIVQHTHGTRTRDCCFLLCTLNINMFTHIATSRQKTNPKACSCVILTLSRIRTKLQGLDRFSSRKRRNYGLSTAQRTVPCDAGSIFNTTYLHLIDSSPKSSTAVQAVQRRNQ